MVVTITPIYAAALALLYIYLSLRVIGYRRDNLISLGDGDDPVMQARMRVHANFAEYVPFALLVMLFVEIQRGHPLWLHLIGAALLIGRLCHAYGVSQHPQIMALRVGGMFLTFAALLLGAAINVILAF